METRKASETRKQTHARWEMPGIVDRPFDEDRPWEEHPYRSDAACTFAWQRDGFEAVSAYVDPVLLDRASAICETLNGIVATQDDLDGLSDAIHRFAGGEGLSASIHERPPEDPTAGLVAVSFTLG